MNTECKLQIVLMILSIIILSGCSEQSSIDEEVKVSPIASAFASPASGPQPLEVSFTPTLKAPEPIYPS